MIKIKAEVKNDEGFEVDYEVEKTTTLEHLLLISRLVDTILENQKDISEKEIIKFIKNRRKYMEE